MKRKAVIQWGGVIAALSGLAALIMQVDSYMLERRRKVAQAAHEMSVMACESQGGRWFRGDCLELNP